MKVKALTESARLSKLLFFDEMKFFVLTACKWFIKTFKSLPVGKLFKMVSDLRAMRAKNFLGNALKKCLKTLNFVKKSIFEGQN